MTDLRGILLAVGALILWSISPFFFTNVGKRVGAFATNLLRLASALMILIGLLLLRHWVGFEVASPTTSTWYWLAASGILGLAIGDAFLYQAFVTAGPERTSQFQALAPAATALVAWIFLKEYLTGIQLAGMGLILAGVIFATSSAARQKKQQVSGYLGTGTVAAIWSALFQGIGTVLAREAFLGQADLDPLLATTIRIGAGGVALWVFAVMKGPLRITLGAWSHPQVLKLLIAGTIAGPVLGMFCYVAALKFAPAGIVTTITFMAPLIIIPAGAKMYGTPINAATVWGTALSLVGVAILGLS